MNKKPFITVLMTVYNRENVCNTIDSILNQSYNNFEFLIIDNASTDRTREVILSYKDPRIRLVVNDKNMGQTYSLNRGLELASGKYIARIDSDDIALPHRLEKQVQFLEDNSDYGLVGSWVTYIDDDNKLTITMKMPVTNEGFMVMQKISCAMYHPAAMYRTSIIRLNNIKYDYDIHMAEDYDLWRQLSQYSKVLNLPEVLIYYRKGGSNDSVRHADLMYDECFSVRTKICKYLDYDKGMLTEICLEKKKKKTIMDCIRIYNYLNNFLRKNISVDSQDFDIIKEHIRYRVVSTCIHYNDSFYALIIRVIYKRLKRLFYYVAKITKN